MHEKSDRPGRNQLSAMFCRLRTSIGDRADRLKAIAHANSIAKEHTSAIVATLLRDWTHLVTRTLSGAVLRLYAHIPLAQSPVHNRIIANVPGPHRQRLIDAARGEFAEQRGL
ncbi:MAG: WS/DGAT domain-containing protein [Mycobacterium sp.]|uniref:WS/DGAT domain-containing protein n=1 Tax=Mycobacterium sp. TaxID=1785 RepID=UPI00262B3F19|nr:WS/DGAT domain-containing protein [Mycobacterium sp.]MDI3315981.1 WS/DGAT domain-containing protein [Mycobacterium sp.]